MHEQRSYFEDFYLDQRFSFGEYLMTEEEIVEFAAKFDPQYFHMDPERALESPLGCLCASGLHTLSAVQRLNVDNLYNKTHLVAGRGINNLSLLRPVVPGDRISVDLSITKLKAYERLGHGLVTAKCSALNQSDEMLAKMDVEFVVLLQPHIGV